MSHYRFTVLFPYSPPSLLLFLAPGHLKMTKDDKDDQDGQFIQGHQDDQDEQDAKDD